MIIGEIMHCWNTLRSVAFDLHGTLTINAFDLFFQLQDHRTINRTTPIQKLSRHIGIYILFLELMTGVSL